MFFWSVTELPFETDSVLQVGTYDDIMGQKCSEVVAEGQGGCLQDEQRTSIDKVDVGLPVDCDSCELWMLSGDRAETDRNGT